MNPLPEPLATILRRCYHVNAMTADWLDAMKGAIKPSGDRTKAALFRRQLADAILNDTMSPAQLEELTMEGVATQEQVCASLTGLWRDLYGEAPVSLDIPPEPEEDDDEE